MLNVLRAGESVIGPALDDNAFEHHTVGGTDTSEPLLEGVGSGEGEGLSVQVKDCFISDSLVQTEDDWLKSGAVRVVGVLALGLVVVTTPVGVASSQGAAKDFTAVGLADEAQFSGRLDKAGLVDHETNLKWQLHEREGDVLDLLGLLLALLGGLLFLLGLQLSLDRVRLST